MKQTHISFVGLASILLVAISSFAACGGLDPRKVTRGPDYSAGGDDSSGGTGNGTGNEPGAGGSDAKGGEPNVNPFGGNFDLGGAPPVVDGPPEVIMVDPADGAVDVDVNTNVSFLFNEAVNPDTVTADSCTLSDDISQVAGDVSLNQDVIATIEPPRRLALATTYTTGVSTDVTDTTGQALKAEFSSTFTTRDGEWEVNQPFVADPVNNWPYYEQASLAADARGNALLIWTQRDGALWARWHRQATGWQPAQRMSAEGVYINNNAAKMAVSPEGDAFVVWTQYDNTNTRYEIMSRRYVGGSWNETPEVATGMITGGLQSNPQGLNIAFKGGHVVVSWMYYVYNDPNYSYYLAAQTTTPDGTWQMYPSTIDSAYSTTRYLSGSSSIGMDSAGNAMFVYSVADATTNLAQLYYSKYVATTGEWASPADLAGAAGLDPYTVIDVALDEAGTAVVAWINNVSPYDLMASRYTKAKGFSTPLPIDDPDIDTAPQISQGSLTTDGTDFILGWRQAVGSTYNVYSSRYSTADAAWSAAELVSDGATSVNGTPLLVSDPHGNSMITWIQTNTEVQFARWRHDGGAWDKGGIVVDGTTTDPPHTYNSYSTAIAVSANGIVNLVTTEGVYEKAEPLLNVFQ